MNEFPEGFWDDQKDMFFDVELIGKVIGVDKARQGDIPHNRHFRRKDAPGDEIHSFDDRRYAVVGRKCTVISICRACRSLDTAISSLTDDGKGTVPYRSVYPPMMEEMAISRLWAIAEMDVKEIEFTDDSYRTLLAIQRMYDGGPITLWDISQEMNVFNHRLLERPVTHLLQQSPGLGVLDRKTLTLHIESVEGAPSKLDELVSRYEEYYRQREVHVGTLDSSDKRGEVLARVKKLNHPSDTPGR
jgi:hypothetical protein